MVKKYGQVVLVTQDLGLERYLDTILKQVHGARLSLSVTRATRLIDYDDRMAYERIDLSTRSGCNS
jgi:mitotic spindle assembly checkpoint protein MAD2